MSSNHRVVLEFDDGVYVKRLIHPEDGCAADLTDPDSTRCYDRKGEGPHECWVQGWFDNASAEELLHGHIEAEIDCRWEFDHMEAHLVDVRGLLEARKRRTEPPVSDRTMAAAEALSDQIEGGYHNHWCAEWQDEHGCECCRRIAEAVLRAAAEPPSGGTR